MGRPLCYGKGNETSTEAIQWGGTIQTYMQHIADIEIRERISSTSLDDE